MEATNQIDHWLKTTVSYGVGFVFLSLFLLIVLYAMFKATQHGIGLLGELRTWVPQWFQQQIKVGQAVCNSADTLTELAGTGGAATRTHAGVLHAVRAAERHVSDNPDKYSEAVREHLRDARSELE